MMKLKMSPPYPPQYEESGHPMQNLEIGHTMKQEIPGTSVNPDKQINKDELYGRYVTVYFGLVSDFDLKPNEALVAHLISSLSAGKGYCYMSKERIAELTHVSNLYDVLEELERKGVIQQRSTGKPRSPTHLYMTDSAKGCLAHCMDLIREERERKKRLRN